MAAYFFWLPPPLLPCWCTGSLGFIWREWLSRSALSPLSL